jgi:DNA-binding HxlR family transcriptional regulator
MAARRKTKDATDTERIAMIRTLLRGGEVARALQVVGDRWSHLIMRDSFLGVRRFEDLRRRTGASRGTLTARLNALVDAGLLYRTPYGDTPTRLEYRLTEKGLAFYPVAISMWRWERRWSDGDTLPPRLVHATCGRALEPKLVCGHCQQPIHRADIGYRPGPGVRRYASARATTRRRESRPTDGDGIDTTLFHCVDTVGDRWMALLMGALFFGLHRYDDIIAVLGISTNILADRLRRLLAAGVLEQRLYQDHPPRHEYHLTDKGWDLLEFTLAMHDWGTRWLPAPHGPALMLRHVPCDHRLRTTLVCGNCGGEVDPRDVQTRAAPAAVQRRGGHGKKPLVRRT